MSVPEESERAMCKYCELESHEIPILSSAAGTVVPSIGALVEGWVLVFPKKHVLSLSQLDQAGWSDFASLVEQAKKIVVAEYGNVVMFEHGSAGEGRLAACGVDHAHLHIVPIEIELRSEIDALADEEGYDWEPVGSRVGVRDSADYIYIHDSTGRWVAYRAWLPGQVVRRAIARSLGLEEWDWKKNARMANVQATTTRLRTA